jgi:hypothetical protein
MSSKLIRSGASNGLSAGTTLLPCSSSSVSD